MAAAAALAAAAPEATLPGSGHVTRVTPNADGTVTLPADANMQTIHAQGRDLVVDLPDGSKIVIVDGAVNVPKIVVGDVEVPALNLAALLIGNEPHPAAGGPSSSGGDFSVPPGDIGPGFHIGDLLPPTELVFTAPQIPLLFPGFVNQSPVAGIGTALVSEEALPTGNADSPPDPTDVTVFTGTIAVSDPDAGDTLTVTLGAPATALTSGGVAIVWTVSADGHTLTGTAGAAGPTVVTVAINDAGAYTVTLLAHLDHPAGAGENTLDFVVPVTVTDSHDAFVTTTLTVTVEDDIPQATAAVLTGSVDEDGVAGVNGVPGDVPGADTVATGSVTSLFHAGADAPLTYALASDAVTTLNGLGLKSGGVTLTYTVAGDTVTAHAGATTVFTFQVTSGGTYTFTLDSHVDHPTGLGENSLVLSLGALITATDTDGDSVNAPAAGLAITVVDDTPVAIIDASVRGSVDEDGVAGANAVPGDVPGADTVATGSVTSLFHAGADAPLSFALASDAVTTLTALNLTSGGTALTYTVSGDTVTAHAGATTVFTFQLTAAGTYTFTLDSHLDHAAGLGENNLVLSLGALVTAVDTDGDPVSALASGVVITIIDDTPVAVADVDSILEGAQTPATGNVITGADGGLGSDANATDGNPDHLGADGFGSIVWTDAVGNTISGGSHHGTLTIDANGNYSYALNNNDPVVQALGQGQTLTDTFTYTITDKDGDPDTTTLTITINGVNAPPVASPATALLSEEALPTGNGRHPERHDRRACDRPDLRRRRHRLDLVP